MIEQIHHVAILTHDIHAAIDHYVETLGCLRKDPIDVEKPGLRWKSVLLPIGSEEGSTALQLIEPLEGPGKDQLQVQGEGAIFEIGFKCKDAVAFADRLQSKDMPPSDLTEQPLDDPPMTSKYGNRFFILPGQHSRGTRLEFVEFASETK